MIFFLLLMSPLKRPKSAMCFSLIALWPPDTAWVSSSLVAYSFPNIFNAIFYVYFITFKYLIFIFKSGSEPKPKIIGNCDYYKMFVKQDDMVFGNDHQGYPLNLGLRFWGFFTLITNYDYCMQLLWGVKQQHINVYALPLLTGSRKLFCYPLVKINMNYIFFYRSLDSCSPLINCKVRLLPPCNPGMHKLISRLYYARLNKSTPNIKMASVPYRNKFSSSVVCLIWWKLVHVKHREHEI